MTVFKHNQKKHIRTTLREVVFGIEDGMVSTLGAITGIAIGSQDRFTVLLAGFVIIAVESISMGIGSYLSNRSAQEVDKKTLSEEEFELDTFPQEEKQELYDMFLKDGWSKKTAKKMMNEIAVNKKLMLKEMAYRELNIYPGQIPNAVRNGAYMFLSYIAGGIIPLIAYLFVPITLALPISIAATLLGLFTLGAVTAKYTSESWTISGSRIALLGGIALAVGFAAGKLFTATY